MKKEIEILQTIISDNKNLEYINDPIFDLLNCFEVDASEVHDGMTFIDSDEAMKLTAKIRNIILEELNDYMTKISYSTLSSGEGK